MTEKFDTAAQTVSPRDAQKGGQGAIGQEHPEISLKQDAPNDGVVRQPNEVSNGLTSVQIQLLCEVGQDNLSELTDDRKQNLERLLSEGYVTPSESLPGTGFQLTAKGIDFLGKRGAGLNEA
jgi:hypothetical protein